MKTFDRVVLVVLALGIWALVLKPSDLTAHGEWHSHTGDYAEEGHSHYGDYSAEDHSHYGYAEVPHDHHLDCTISGSAEGYSKGKNVYVDYWGYTTVECLIN